MRVLNLCRHDWSNFSHENANALRSVGVQAVDIKTNPHKFAYATESMICDYTEIMAQAEKADIIQIMHTDDRMYEWVEKLGKRVMVYHTGTGYRQKPDYYNVIFRNVEKTFIDSPEFYNLGAKNIVYCATAIDTRTILYSDPHNSKTTFAHFPSKPHVKGTPRVLEMISKIPGIEFIFDTKQVPWRENIDRISKCDVYIELFAPMQDGKKYGSFGVTAFEAAALGKIVVTNSTHHLVYKKFYGDSELVIANNEYEFTRAVTMLMSMTAEEIDRKKLSTYRWVCGYHSYEATGNYLLKYLRQ